MRDDWGNSYAAAQACHGVAAFIYDFPNAWNNQIIVVLRVTGEHALREMRDKLIMKSIPHSVWKEPDRNNEMTALAAVDTGTLFKRYELL